jgi:hypothetical protein
VISTGIAIEQAAVRRRADADGDDAVCPEQLLRGVDTTSSLPMKPSVRKYMMRTRSARRSSSPSIALPPGGRAMREPLVISRASRLIEMAAPCPIAAGHRSTIHRLRSTHT